MREKLTEVKRAFGVWVNGGVKRKMRGKGAELWAGVGTAQMWPRCCFEGQLGTGVAGKGGKGGDEGRKKPRSSWRLG